MGRKNKKGKKKSGRGQDKPLPEKVEAVKYTVDQLLDKAEEYVDTFEIELAQKFCERAIQLEPDNVRALETSGTLLLQLGDNDGAKHCFGRCIEVAPDTGHGKYMYMGQLMGGVEAIQCFNKGIQLMQEAIHQHQPEGAEAAASPDLPTCRDISDAYCAIAEMYLTDECFTDMAADQCGEHLQKAEDADPSNPEVYHLLASYHLSQDDKKTAGEMVDKGMALWLPQLKAASEAEGGALDPVQVCPVRYPARVNVCKMLIELEKYETAAEALELLLDEDDEVVEVWYLLGWSHHLQGEDYFNNARFYLTKAQEVARECQCDDTQMVDHIDQLLDELGPGDPEEENGEEDDVGGMDLDALDTDSDEEAAAAADGDTDAVMEH